MSALISQDDIYQFENMIYLPMVISIFQKDRKQFEDGAFKLKGPYLELIESACKIAEKELRETKLYMRERKLKIETGKRDEFASEYFFYHDGFNDMRRYMNVRLRNRTEELIRVYLAQAATTEKPSAD